MRPINSIVFLLHFFLISIVTSEEHGNVQKYDPNSLEMNKKLMKVFLKLFYQTANRVMTLKNKPENRVDADVQNISISDILKPQNHEIQGRFNSAVNPAETRGFFDNLNPMNAISILSKSATGGLVDPKELAPNLGQVLVEISNKALDGLNSSVRITDTSGHEPVARIDDSKSVNSTNSTANMRFLDFSLDNSTSTLLNSTTNSTDKAEGRINLEIGSSTVEPVNATKAPEVTKREASVLSLNNNINSKIESLKITDPTPGDKGLAAEPVRVIRSSNDKNSDDIFDFPEENDIKDVEPVIKNLKLGEIVDKFSYI